MTIGQMSEARYLSAADTAKIVRKVLKREFSGIKFSVTSSTYSGGASIDIHWVDGPTTKQVDAHVGAFSGKGFDGMIDLSYSKDAWLMPDGSVSPAKSRGSGNSGDMDAPYSLPAPSPDAELVHFGSGYIHLKRHHSPTFVWRVAKEMAAKTGWHAPEIIETTSYWTRNKQIPTAYFENWRNAEDRQNWEEFSQALYLTPGDAPLVTRFDYAFEEHEPEPEPAVAQVAPERTEAEQIEIYHRTLEEINESLAEQDATVAAQGASTDPKTIPHEDRTPEERAEAEAIWAESVRQAKEPESADVVKLLLHEVRTLATEIITSTGSDFIARCVARKVRALEDKPTLEDVIKVGDDLTLIAEQAS